MAKMTNNEMEAMEKKLAEYLDERWYIAINSESERQATDRSYYNGVCAAVAQIGGWERDDNGTNEAYAEIRLDYQTNQPFAVLFDKDCKQI